MECNLCPRGCSIDREKQLGFCGAGPLPTVAKIMLHQWEEPCICYGAGSGAIFFSGCQLRCVFCQNHIISNDPIGETMDRNRLCRTFLKLEEKGACNINLVSATPHLNEVIPALKLAKEQGLSLPVVWNSGGYETEESIARLEGLVDIYLPDFKFYDPQKGLDYAGAREYPQVAKCALLAMQKQVGTLLWEEDKLKRGVLLRHLVLPGNTKDSIAILDWLADQFPPEAIALSLLWQYTPMHKAKTIPELNRKVTKLEYQRIVKRAEELGFQTVYTQEKSSATEAFTPDFLDKNDSQ